MSELAQTPLHDLHVELGARMVGFAGHAMPVQYPMGVLKEHLHTRAEAGLFDVSHMGQLRLSGPSWDAVARGMEALVPMDVLGLADGRQRYGFLTNDAGGIEDDLMFARLGDALIVVVNAACREQDVARLRAGLPDDIVLEELTEQALIALQGPGAAAVIGDLDGRALDMRFMDVGDLNLCGHAVQAARSGYTGEDGFEISVAVDEADTLARALLAQRGVAPVGLGARDSLRLEAGLCLYGSDIDATTGPVEASLGWAIPKVRRAGGARAGGYPGAEAIAATFDVGPERVRVGLRPEGRAPMRQGVVLFDAEADGREIGTVTSGGYGPTVQGPVAMGYVAAGHDVVGTRIWGEVRGSLMAVEVVPLPFVPAGFKR